MDRRIFLVSGTAALTGCATTRPTGDVIIRTEAVWPTNSPPGSPDVMLQPQIIERSKDRSKPDRAIIHVSQPSLKVFQPLKPDGSAVLICPGGGYQRVVIDKEGDETAMRLALAGVTAIVLTYRLPEDGWVAGRDAPLQDAQRAMRLLRSGQVAPHIDPKRIGVIGFSAGGHLAAALALDGERKTYVELDAADAQSPRPDFAGLIYAAYLDGSGSAALAKGEGAPRNLIEAVTRDTQPVFLLHAADDATVAVESSVRMYQALKAAGVAAELHVFPEGGHGFGIARGAGKPVEVWPDLYLRWGRARGMFR